MPTNLLVIDDDCPHLINVLPQRWQKLQARFHWASTYRDAQELLPVADVILLDLDFRADTTDLEGYAELSGQDKGLAILKNLLQRDWMRPIIMLTSNTNPLRAIECVKQGASGYIDKASNDHAAALRLIRDIAEDSRRHRAMRQSLSVLDDTSRMLLEKSYAFMVLATLMDLRLAELLREGQKGNCFEYSVILSYQTVEFKIDRLLESISLDIGSSELLRKRATWLLDGNQAKAMDKFYLTRDVFFPDEMKMEFWFRSIKRMRARAAHLTAKDTHPVDRDDALASFDLARNLLRVMSTADPSA